jgi:hypothetical protein
MKEGMFLGSVPGVDTYLVYPEQKGEEDRPGNPYSQVLKQQNLLLKV